MATLCHLLYTHFTPIPISQGSIDSNELKEMLPLLSTEDIPFHKVEARDMGVCACAASAHPSAHPPAYPHLRLHAMRTRWA